MNDEYEVDIAISCAEEDLIVATNIAEALKNMNVKYYLYIEHIAYSWGRNLFELALKKYHSNAARYMLMLVSRKYVSKHWSNIERQIALTVTRSGEPYILPLYLEDDIVDVDGLSKNIRFIKWQNDAGEVARLIDEKIRGHKMSSVAGGLPKPPSSVGEKRSVSMSVLVPEMRELYHEGYPEANIIDLVRAKYPLSKYYLKKVLADVIREVNFQS